MPTGINVRSPHYRGVTAVWLLLMSFTLLSWWLGGGAGSASEGPYVVTSILAVTFIKIRLVIVHFMEVREVPAAIRAPFEIWCIGVCGALIYVLLFQGAHS